MKNQMNSQRKLEGKRGMFFRIGLAISLLITFIAFEWETKIARYEFPDNPTDSIETVIIPNTFHKPVKPIPEPKLEPNKKNNKPIDIEFIIVPDEHPVTTISDSVLIPDLVDVTSKPEPKYVEPEVFFGAEIMPMFPGGEDSLKKFLIDNTRFPEKARSNGINGTVYLVFVINQYGEVVNVETGHSPSPILEAEAKRVMSIMPRWSPAKQGGLPVNIRMGLPFTFRLK